jgi:type III restriction enzyme
MSTMRVRDNENTQTACTRRFFDEISTRLTDDRGKYGVVTNYGELLDLVRRAV